MPSRDDTLQLIREAYEARVRGDKEALGRYWAEGARFEIAGRPDLLQNVPLTAVVPMDAIGALIDQFKFDDLQLVDSVVEGNKAAVRWRVKVAYQGGAAQPTELLDLVELDDDGKIKSFVQYADTALVRHMTG